MVTDAAAESEPHAEPPRGRPFVLAPFRGLRFDPAAVGDLGTVISPPYDVLDAETVRELEAANRRNIVRLILSRRFERPYLAVRTRLETWRRQSYLRADDEAALYLYEYTVEGTTVRGLIGLVGLRQESERVVLPHEDVMSGPVNDRAFLMRATETNLEPILLVHRGSRHLRERLQECTEAAPLLAFSAVDGSRHRMWTITDPDLLSLIADELRGSQALIADGHHRYAAYLRLQQEMRDPATPLDRSPWDYGLAMLVDQHDHSLSVGPIHRSVAALTISDVQENAGERGDEVVTLPTREAAFAEIARRAGDDGTASFVITDGHTWAVLTTRRSHEVDAAVLHEELFEAWHVTDEQVGYHHSLDQALHMTDRQPGIVVAVNPPDLGQVIETAARGVRLPRKSTSFSPKPRMGLVMRDLRDA